ncbi:hypothetical protein ABT023_16390 [Micromonospora sp. NPDC002296]|uniref:hypothetical protein n=1 Tax=Micromonospora sp. NPDC002296 TaxID=3154271 RepID=UPI00333486F3
MQHQTLPELDLSPEGVAAIRAALVEAGLPVYHVENAGDAIDLTLRPATTGTTLIALSWRQARHGWYLAESDAAGVEQCMWPLGHDLEDVAAEAARLLAQTERVEAEMAAEAAADADPAPAEPAEPDYWLSLAADLRKAADRIATLAGTDRQPDKVHLDFTVAYPGNTDLTATDLADRIAEAFGATTHTSKFPGGDRVYQVRAAIGALRVEADTYLPAEPSELESLRARVAELEAQQAEVAR